MSKTNGSFKILIVAGLLLFGIVAFVIISSTSTVVAIVPNQEIPAGIRIEESMLKEISIPANTPRGFITDKGSLIGQKLRTPVSPDQLIYINSIITSWEDFSDGQGIPDDYIVTSIRIPSERAVGGLLTAGDYVDILGIPNRQASTLENEVLNSYLGDVSLYSYGAEGIHLYWVLANVKILETDSELSQGSEGSFVISDEATTSGSSSRGEYYIIALSYNDYLKLRLSEQYLDLWLNVSPKYNEENDPLLWLMQSGFLDELHDSEQRSILDEEGNLTIEPIILRREDEDDLLDDNDNLNNDDNVENDFIDNFDEIEGDQYIEENELE